MAREQPPALLDPLRRLIARQTGSSLTDAQLLDDFVSRRDEAAFEVLVWRHGAMVLAVCKRVLRDAHEAEDAFQAAFLVFARKAGSVGRGEVVAAWLYKVAYRIALRLRAAAVKRAPSGEATDDLPAPGPAGDADWRDLRPVLDDEIARLPEKYRAPFVLCYLEGRTNEEAAAQLGCPKGTVLSRLSRGRDRLRARLTRRGVALTATALALTLSQNAASATVPAALVPSTVGAAIPFAAGKAAAELVPAHVAALTEGALKAMTLIKLKVASAVLALAVLGTGIAWAAGGGGGDAPDRVEAPVAAVPPADGPRDRERPTPAAPELSGKVVSVAKDGKSFAVETPPTERGGAPGKAAVKVGDKAAVSYHGVGPNGAKPTEGYEVSVQFEAGSKEVAASVSFIGAGRVGRVADRTGVVLAVAADGKSVTLRLRGERTERGAEPKTETVSFDAKTVLVFANVAPGEAKVTADYAADVWYADDGKTAAKVQFLGRAQAGRRDKKGPDVTGTVMRAAPDGKTIVVEVPPAERGAAPTRVTITIGDKAAVAFNNVPADGAKAAPGMQAQVWLADGEKEAAAQAVFTGTVPERWTTVAGKVVAVAADGSSFTVEGPTVAREEEPKRTEVKLTAKTQVLFFAVGPDEAKVTVGLTATARLLDGSTDTASRVTFTKAGERGR